MLQVQHMIGGGENVQQQQQLTTYKVQSNQYSGGGERITSPTMDEEERPGSKLKQNIE